MGSGSPRRQQWTLVLASLASLLEKADEVLLPAVYKEVAAALGASPTALGSLTLCRAIVQAACYPLAAYAAARHDRPRVVAVGAFLWAAATLLFGVSGTFAQMAISRGLNGIGLALVIPAISSLVADCTDDTTRGSAFGWVHMARHLGSIMGNSFGVLLAPTSFLGVAGWRLAFHAAALISVTVGALMWFFAWDPRPAPTSTASAADEAKKLIEQARDVVRVPTFQVIVAQGVAGSIPWSALTFAAMWLELVGFTHWQTSVITSLYMLATALGSLFGGLVGDPVARRFPDTGRIALSQVSSASAIPLATILLLALPNDPSTGVAHAVAFFVMGFAMSWNAPATNKYVTCNYPFLAAHSSYITYPSWRLLAPSQRSPIFAEIVPEKARTTVYALDRCFETVFASLAPPVVGILAERVFGYKPASSGASAETDRENAAALSKAVYAEVAVPMTVCCLTYSFLYCTYPRDRQRAQMDALVASDDRHCHCEALAGNGSGANAVAPTATVHRDGPFATNAVNATLLVKTE